MKGGYNNTANGYNATSVLGLSAALSQARLNGSGGGNAGAGGRSSRNGTFNGATGVAGFAGDAASGYNARSYNATGQSNGVTSKGQSMPKVRHSGGNRGNNTAKDYSVAMAKNARKR